jgi:hypothetical protein
MDCGHSLRKSHSVHLNVFLAPFLQRETDGDLLYRCTLQATGKLGNVLEGNYIKVKGINFEVPRQVTAT